MSHREKGIRINSIIYDDEKMEIRLGDIGKRIRQERLCRDLSISKLAELSNLSVSCVSKAESVRCRISLKALLKIAAALDIPAGELMGEKDAGPEEGVPAGHAEAETAMSSGERFERITEHAGEETVDFILGMADELVRVIGKREEREKEEE